MTFHESLYISEFIVVMLYCGSKWLHIMKVCLLLSDMCLGIFKPSVVTPADESSIFNRGQISGFLWHELPLIALISSLKTPARLTFFFSWRCLLLSAGKSWKWTNIDLKQCHLYLLLPAKMQHELICLESWWKFICQGFCKSHDFQELTGGERLVQYVL